MINSEIILLCSKYLGFDAEPLDEAYRDIYDSIIDSTIINKNIVFSKKELSFTDSEHFFLTGIDLPILLSGNHSLTLMIVGSEPLRNEKFFFFVLSQINFELDFSMLIKFQDCLYLQQPYNKKPLPTAHLMVHFQQHQEQAMVKESWLFVLKLKRFVLKICTT
jgi:hypothetical protein